MKNKPLSFLLCAICFMLFFSCSKDDAGSVGGSQSEFGEVGNTIDWTVGQFGISGASMSVSALENGVSTFTCSGTASSSTYVNILSAVPTDRFPGTVTITGNTVQATVNAKITDEGMQVVFNNGSKLTLVNYNASVGDKYSATVGGVTLQNEVVQRSTEDDYFWGGMLIKVITVKYTSHAPGINYVEHYYNHKWGLVGLAVYFEDGTVKYAGCAC